MKLKCFLCEKEISKKEFGEWDVRQREEFSVFRTCAACIQQMEKEWADEAEVKRERIHELYNGYEGEEE